LTNLFWQVICLRDHLWHRRDLGARCARSATGAMRRTRESWACARQAGGPPPTMSLLTGPAFNYHILLEIDHLVERLVADRPGYLLSHPSVIMGSQSIAWIMASAAGPA
jgi:hypothetical protein